MGRHLWSKLGLERYSNVPGHMLPDPCSNNMNPLSPAGVRPDPGRTVSSQTVLNSVKSYNNNSPNIWVEILVDIIFWRSECNFLLGTSSMIRGEGRGALTIQWSSLSMYTSHVTNIQHGSKQQHQGKD